MLNTQLLGPYDCILFLEQAPVGTLPFFEGLKRGSMIELSQGEAVPCIAERSPGWSSHSCAE